MLKTTNLMINLLERVTSFSLRLGLLKVISLSLVRVSIILAAGDRSCYLEFLILTDDTRRKVLH